MDAKRSDHATDYARFRRRIGPQAFVQPPARVTEFPSYERHAAYVPLADGTRLAITWYLPAGGPSVARFPVLLWYMPGHRESVDPRTGVIRPGMDAGELAYFTGRGYVVAVVEMRGSGASRQGGKDFG